MKILQRHIGLTIIMATLLVLMVLVGLQVFISFINELSDIGAGNYNLWQVFQYVILTMPSYLYSFFPMASLLGCLTGLGYLASNSELIVMRASGMSILQITCSVLSAAIFLLIIATFLGEAIGPQASEFAKIKKEYAKTGIQTSASTHGLWLRKNSDFIYIQNILPNKKISNIYKYHFDQNGKLLSATYIKNGSYNKHTWQLHNIFVTQLNTNSATTTEYAKQTWNIRANLNLLRSSRIDLNSISIIKLYKLIRFRKANGLTTQQYSFTFWQRVFQPFATIVMILLSIPFIFGPLRTVTMGLRILAGICVGFTFYILNQFFGPLSLVYQIPPLLSAVFPSIIFLSIGGWLILRLK
ncbi:MAG: LPS export ABC transporter permease LptG [Gammaproteobacteria bacterium]